MSREEFYSYILNNFSISGEAMRLIDNILCFVEKSYMEQCEQYATLCDLLGGIGLTDDELRKVFMY